MLTHATQEWIRLANATVGGRPLAATRVVFGLASLVMLNAFHRRFSIGLDPDAVHIGWPIVDDRLVGLPPALITIVWGTGAVLLIAGVWPRVGAAGVAAGLGVFLAADRQHYANGGYFVLLIAVLLVMADTNASWTPWGPDRRRAAWWPTFLLASQVSIVYFFAGIQKFRRSALRGDTIDWQLKGPAMDHVSFEWLPQAINLAGGILELFCAVAFWFPRTRKVALAAGVLIHLGVVAFIRDGPDLWSFGLATVAVYPVFWSVRSPSGQPSTV